MTYASALDTQILTKALVESHDAIITYNALSAIVGGDVTGSRLRGCLNTARRIVEREHRIVFAAVRSVGLRRLNGEELVASLSDVRDRIRRASRRGIKKAVTVDFDKLTQGSQIRHQAAIAYMAAIECISTQKATTVLETKVTPQIRLPIAATLEAFRAMEKPQ